MALSGVVGSWVRQLARSRLLLAVLCFVATGCLTAWGLTSSGGSQTDTSRPSAKSPFDLATSVPKNVSKMHLVLNATFGGTRLKRSLWDTCYPWIANQGAGCTNFNNPEREWYLPKQDQVSGGVLHIVSSNLRTVGASQSGSRKIYGCRSGMVTSHPGFNFKYGYIQVTAQIPNNPGLWPALWLAASNLKWPPEIDMLEHLGPPTSRTGVFFHAVGRIVRVYINPGSLFNGWHTFGLAWTKSQLAWYIDNKLIVRIRQDVPQQKMYFIANLAHFAGHPHSPSCDGRMLIRSIKVWQS